jgi:hypothetical protein
MKASTPPTPRSTLETLKAVKEELGGPPQWDLAQRHRFGSALLEAFAGSRADRYGKRLMGSLAEALAMDAGVLHKLRKFAATFGGEELAHLVGVRRPDGRPLAWSHVRLLLEVTDRGDRARLVGEAAAGGWTATRLRAAVREAKGGRPRRGGPKPAAPADLAGMIHQMHEFLAGWENRHTQIWSKDDHSLDTLAGALPERGAKAKAVEDLEALRQCWSRAACRSREMADDAGRALDRLRG